MYSDSVVILLFCEEWINGQLFVETIGKDKKIATLFCEE
jgi:hypothetical protein